MIPFLPFDTQLRGLPNGAAPKFGGSWRIIVGWTNCNGSFPGSMLIAAGPASHRIGELHWIAMNAKRPRRANGHGVSVGQLECPPSLSRTTTGTLWPHIEDVSTSKRDLPEGRSARIIVQRIAEGRRVWLNWTINQLVMLEKMHLKRIPIACGGRRWR